MTIEEIKRWAAAIIRSQQDRIERLTAKLKERDADVERLNRHHAAAIKEKIVARSAMYDEVKRLESLAATKDACERAEWKAVELERKITMLREIL